MKLLTEECQRYADFWQSLPKDGFVPNKEDFFPEEVPTLLPNFIMHDLISSEVSIIRLVGTSISSRYSEDITGRNYLDFVDEERKKEAGAALFKMSQQPCAMRVLLRQKTKSGRMFLSESLGFPLKNNATGRHVLLFLNIIIDTDDYSLAEPDQLIYLGVNQRDYIDIGAGIPAEETE